MGGEKGNAYAKEKEAGVSVLKHGRGRRECVNCQQLLVGDEVFSFGECNFPGVAILEPTIADDSIFDVWFAVIIRIP